MRLAAKIRVAFSRHLRTWKRMYVDEFSGKVSESEGSEQDPRYRVVRLRNSEV